MYKELKAAMFECNVTLWRVGGQSMTQQPKNDYAGDAAFDFSHTKAEIRWNFDNPGEAIVVPEFEVAKMPIWMFNSLQACHNSHCFFIIQLFVCFLQIDGDVQLLTAPEIHIVCIDHCPFIPFLKIHPFTEAGNGQQKVQIASPSVLW